MHVLCIFPAAFSSVIAGTHEHLSISHGCNLVELLAENTTSVLSKIRGACLTHQLLLMSGL